MEETKMLENLPSEESLEQETEPVIPSIEEMVDEIKKACDENGLEYHETVGRIYIKSPSFANWYIDVDIYPIQLYHQNYKKKTIKTNRGYHRHDNVSGYSAEDMIRYIKAHDTSTLAHLPISKKRKKG